MIKRISAAAVAVALALTWGALAIPTAEADQQADAASKTVAIRTKRGAVYFYSYGDVLHVGDYYKDGLGIRGYAIANGKRYTAYTNEGLNSVDDKNLNFKEGTPVWIQLCYTNNGKNVKCSGTVKGYA